MTAGKVQPPVQARIDVATRAVSDQPSIQRDDFTKLLQAKKDGTQQAGKADTGKKAEPKRAEEANADGKASENVSEDGKAQETAADDGKEEDLASKEALNQAVLQQAAAQILIQPDMEAEQVQEAVESSVTAIGTEAAPEMVSETAVQAETAVQPETAVQAEAAVQANPERTENVKSAKQQIEAVAETTVQEAEPQKVTRTEECSDSGNQTEAKSESKAEVPAAASDDRKVRQDTNSQYSNQDTVYNAEIRTSERVQEAVTQRTETIPLKTTPEQLPQDLGKTLASRTLEAGRTLTVELEPANLGKLTIRLVYEGDRASLSIMASNPRTLDMLSQKASEIAAILEEKTGQETIIYTQPAQQGSEQYDEQQNQNRSKEQGEPEEQKNQRHGEDTHQAESFAQQLRLGLV